VISFQNQRYAAKKLLSSQVKENILSKKHPRKGNAVLLTKSLHARSALKDHAIQ